MKNSFFCFLCFLSFGVSAQPKSKAVKAIFLETISWTEAQKVLNPDQVVLIPLGAGSKEHGPHLPLSTDFLQAEAYKIGVAGQRKLIVTPTVNYGFYPAFIKFPGSTSLHFSTSTDMIVQLVHYLAAYGPKRFYIINVGVSTTPTLHKAAEILAEEGILLYYSDYDREGFVNTEKGIKTKEFGGHADEIETSNILAVKPEWVHMDKAVNDSSGKGGAGPLTPVPVEGGLYVPSGINGYAALGTAAKGKKAIKAFTEELIREIDSISTCPLPLPKDNTAIYKQYEGTYTSGSGINLIISQKDNKLYFVINKRDLRNFYWLIKSSEDYYSSMFIDVLFVKDEKGKFTKAWCRLRGEGFWMTKQ